MTRKTTGRKYRCDKATCEKFKVTWIVPVTELTPRCVCDQSPTFLGYVEEEV